jgi:hypothetical protein
MGRARARKSAIRNRVKVRAARAGIEHTNRGGELLSEETGHFDRCDVWVGEVREKRYRLG